MGTVQIHSNFERVLTALNRGMPAEPEDLKTVLFSQYLTNLLENWRELLYLLASRVRLQHALERQTGLLRSFVYDLLVKDADVVVIGDLHGDIESAWEIVAREKILHGSGKLLIFLGDYFDRGPMQLSTLAFPLYLKVTYPNRIYLLRGNHDEWKNNAGRFAPVVVGDVGELFLTFWMQYFDLSLFNELFHLLEELPVVAQLNKRIGLVHAGLPRPTQAAGEYENITTIDDLNDEKILHEMRWCRPENKDDVIVTGETNFSIARVHFINFTRRLGWAVIIRGHDPVLDGYELLSKYDNRLLTIHSTGRNPRYGDGEAENTAFPGISPAYARIRGELISVLRVFGDDRPIAKLRLTEGVVRLSE